LAFVGAQLRVQHSVFKTSSIGMAFGMIPFEFKQRCVAAQTVPLSTCSTAHSPLTLNAIDVHMPCAAPAGVETFGAFGAFGGCRGPRNNGGARANQNSGRAWPPLVRL